MDSAISPREIQSRIRSGESLEDVARDAGVPAERIEPFAAPVLAEREHVAGQALSGPVRRRGESSSARSLRQVVREHLQHQGVDIDDLVWDSWREPDRRWCVVGRYEVDGDQQEAHFTFDPRGRFSVAQDDPARALIGEPLPGADLRADDPDSEPTVDLDDELAIVRATQATSNAHEEPTSPAAVSPGGRSDDSNSSVAPNTAGSAVPIPAGRQPLGTTARDTQDDLIGHASQLDVLYDMLSSFDEDSVNIYADLQVPWHLEPAGQREADENEKAADTASTEPDDQDTCEGSGDHDRHTEEPPVEEPPVEEPPGASSQPDFIESEQDHLEQDHPEQDPLVEAPAPKRRTRGRKGRATIPSWDEIMFGGPKPTK